MTTKMTFPRTLLILVGSALLVLSCASSHAPSAESSGSPAAASSGGAGGAGAAAPGPLKKLPGMDVTWNDLDLGQRKEYMKKVVQPRMSDEFAGFNAKYAEFTCATCHGSSAKKGNFKMPNAELPKLPKDPEAMKKLAATKPDYVMFMADMVKPHMADLLGIKAFDMKTKTGSFGCGNCHVIE